MQDRYRFFGLKNRTTLFMSNLAANDTALPTAGATALATMASVILKFIAVWTLPLLTEAAISKGDGALGRQVPDAC